MANQRLTLIDIGRPGDPTIFDESVRTAAAEIIARYPAGQSRSALLPMLHLVQSEQGYVSADGVAFCADLLELTKAQVAAVATFYTMFKRSPTGEYLVSVCTNTLCAMLGGDEIYRALSDRLGIGMNETAGTPGTPGSITLEHAECLAACDYAPVVTVNYEFFDNQTVDSALGLVAERQPADADPGRAAVQLRRDLAADRRLRRPAAAVDPGDRDRAADRGRGTAGPAARRAGAGVPAR
jgi:NADH-quinone oxidoreductase subunit E